MIRSIRTGVLALSAVACLGAYWYSENKPAYVPRPEQIARDAAGAAEWLRMMRADFVTGEYDTEEIQKVRKAVTRAMSHQTKSVGLNWIEMGPDNVGGRTRSIVKDPSDPNGFTLYAGAVSGGLWRTTDGGNTWQRVGAFDQNLAISSVTIMGNGHIYVGTGSSFDQISGTGGSGFIGAGLFKSTDGGGSFSLVIGPTSPFSGGSWSEINKIVADPQNSDGLYVGGNAGFKYYDESDDAFTTPSGISATANCRAIEVSGDGSVVVAGINANQCWVSTDGGDSFSQAEQGSADDQLPTTGVQRMEFALSPDPGVNNYLYALQANNGRMNGAFFSNDNGQTWQRIWPAGFGTEGVPELDVFGDNAQGWYDNVIAVRPSHPDEVWLGGVGLWKTSLGGAPTQIALPESEVGCFICVHADAHEITWTNEFTCFIGCDGGVYKTTAAGAFFYGHNRDYTTTQFYSMAFSPKGRVIGGLQDNGTQYLDFTGNTPKEAHSIFGGDGFDCDISQMDPNIMYATVYNGALGRSNDNGNNFGGFYNVRLNDLADANDGNLGDFYTNIRLYEDFDDPSSTDSVHVVFELEEGDSLLPGDSRPVPYHGPIVAVMQEGTFVNTTGSTIYGPFTSDTLVFQDRVTSLFAVGFGSSQGVWVTRDAMNFIDPVEWWQVTTATGNVNCLEWTADGNDLFIGTSGGEVWRVHGFVDNRDSLHCDVGSSQYALQVMQLLNVGNTITGLAPDPNNTEHLVVTLGNYGGSGKVRETFQAVSGSPPSDWDDIWNPDDPDLDGMPVYDAIIHKGDPNVIVVGTEYGMMATNDGGATWSFENEGIGRVPVFAVRQQSWDWNYNPFGGGYIENPWVIYAGSHGRGIFRTETLLGLAPEAGGPAPMGGLSIFPNPANTAATIGFMLNASAEVSISIYDMNGRAVKQQKVGVMAPGARSVLVDVNSLGAGAYIAELSAGTVRRTARFVVSR